MVTIVSSKRFFAYYRLNGAQKAIILDGMIEREPQLTTSQAAGLIGMHESSVKRWCNADDLPCSYTGGGHRRIALSTLLAFARSQDLPCSLLALAPWEAEVWQALAEAQSKDDYAGLAALTYRWLRAVEADLPSRLFRLCIERELALSALFDRVMAAVMHRAGEDWYEGRLDVGDVHLMTQIMFDALYALRHFLERRRNGRGMPGPVALVGGAEKNQHELAALMVRTLLDEAGWRTLYLGADVPTEELAFQQTKRDARLVCVSMMAPRAPADALRLLRVLARLYDEQHPYRLALGGLDLHELQPPKSSDLPFQDCLVLPTMEVFAHWMHASPLPSAEAPASL